MQMTTAISPDANGNIALCLRGHWSADAERALAEAHWELVSIFGTDWEDYRNLAPFAGRIRWLRVPFGPDKSKGLEDLTALERLELLDSPKPPVDFRKLPHLKELQTVWEKKSTGYLALPHLESLTIHSLGTENLEWLPEPCGLTLLSIRGGKLQSLKGLRAAQSLRDLRCTDLKQCTDIADLRALARLRVAEIDAPKATVDNLQFLATLPALERIMISAPVLNIDWTAVATHPTLRSVALTAPQGYDVSDEDIARKLRSAGREVRSFKRIGVKHYGFIVEL